MTVTLNPDRRQIELNGRAVRLQPQVFTIATILFDRPRRLVSTEWIFQVLWGNDPNGGPLTARRAVNVQVCHLRAALRELGADCQITTEHGVGYRLDLAGSAEPLRVAA